MRIVDAIKKGEDFVVYVVSPLSSVTQDGAADKAYIREHLKTNRNMYRVIGEALTEADSEKSPFDFLAFFCLNRDSENTLQNYAVFDDQYFLFGNYLL